MGEHTARDEESSDLARRRTRRNLQEHALGVAAIGTQEFVNEEGRDTSDQDGDEDHHPFLHSPAPGSSPRARWIAWYSRYPSSSSVAATRSTARRRFSIPIPDSRSTRPASALVSRSSHSSTGQLSRRRSLPANSATRRDMVVSLPLWPIGLPSTTRSTSYSRATSAMRSRSSAMRVRSSVGSPCAVMPSASDTARPMRFMPKSMANTRWDTVLLAPIVDDTPDVRRARLEAWMSGGSMREVRDGLYRDFARVGAGLGFAALNRQVNHHRLLVAVEILVAAQAIAPDFHGEALAGHFAEAALGEELGRSGKREDRLELEQLRLAEQLLGERAAHAVAVESRSDAERADFREVGGIELERPAARSEERRVG